MSYEPYPVTPPPPGGPVNVPLGQPLRGASFQQAVQRYFKKYAVFTGRASRSEFWWVILFNFIVGVVFSILGAVSGVFKDLGYLYDLAVIVPGIALNARRLHDINKSGWWQLIGLIPIVGWIIVIIWFCQDAKAEGARFDS